ncbi:hypothetical protein [Streptomyces sp. GZWMJZ-114]|uniref:hypothetical protein n=1 Tax=Streptomyces sp. GZWMJZ-114 TaxID=2494734 RepID=UPI001012D955|nr:hypothetical protein [Streptomyces sp. GZWMJZ-114]
MAELRLAGGPLGSIRAGRLGLRAPGARDPAAFAAPLAPPDVRTCLGGPRPCDAFVREVPEMPESWAGSLVVARKTGR